MVGDMVSGRLHSLILVFYYQYYSCKMRSSIDLHSSLRVALHFYLSLLQL